jgi:sulfite exporter TauE/SafE
VNAELDLWFAFLTGVMGAAHCVGMCIGVNGAFHAGMSRAPRLVDLAGFHGTRIAVYTVLGVGGAALGQVVVQSGWVGKAQALMMMVAGSVLVVMGLRLAGRDRPTADLERRVIVTLGTEPAGKRDRLAPLVAGMFNGLVPCSLVSLVAIKGAATGNPYHAGLMMLAFGVGTLPTLVALSLVGGLTGRYASGWWARALGVFVVTAGTWTLYQGYVVHDIMRGLANW